MIWGPFEAVTGLITGPTPLVSQPSGVTALLCVVQCLKDHRFCLVFYLERLFFFLHVILGVNRQKAQEWCIKHGFELVELSPEELPEDDGKC